MNSEHSSNKQTQHSGRRRRGDELQKQSERAILTAKSVRNNSSQQAKDGVEKPNNASVTHPVNQNTQSNCGESTNVHSPGSKENQNEESPPKRQRIHENEESDIPHSSSSNRPDTSSGSGTSASENAGTSSQEPGLSEETMDEGRPEAGNSRRKRSATEASNEANSSKSPRPHPALEYYHRKLGGEFELTPASGTIKKIVLTNFMCHANFEQEWNPNLNFIIGENGSGKSALLSGIIVGLGARANVTSRTKSVADLVKTGENSARIEITLTNSSSSNLDEKKYGQEIIIRRAIDCRGSSTYKINDGINPKFRPLSKDELEIILVNLGIMIDNPVAVLNQEAARSFLKTKDPKDKYTFFFEGSGLARLNEVLGDINENMRLIEKGFENLRDQIASRKEQIARNKKLLQTLDEADRMEELTETLVREYYWAKVIIEEQKRDSLNTDREDKMKSQTALDEGLQKLMTKKSDLEANARATPEVMNTMKTRLRDDSKQEADTIRDINQLVRQAGDLKAKLRTGVTKISSHKRNIETLERKITELSTSGEAEAERLRREHDEKLEELETEKSRREHELNDIKLEREKFLNGTESIRTQLTDLKEKERDTTFQLRNLKEDLRNHENKNSDAIKYSAFGEQIVVLMSLLNANHDRFKLLPRGPLGACFKVKNEKWVALIELILGSHLFDFVVENSADQALLNRFIGQAFSRRSSISDRGIQSRRPSVICNKAAFNRKFDVSRSSATTQAHPTVLDMIEIEENAAAVYNTLIDVCHVERILLFESNRAGCDLLKDKHNAGFPRNCDFGFTLDYYQITPDPRYRLEAKRRENQSKFLKCGSAAQIRYIRQGIQDLERVLIQLQPELVSKGQEESRFRNELNEMEDKLRLLQRKLAIVKTNIASHAKITIQAPDTASFVEELQDERSMLEVAEREQQEQMALLEEIVPNVEERKQRKLELTNEIENLRKDIQEKTDDMERFQEKTLQYESSISGVKTRIRDMVAQIEILDKQLKELQAIINERVKEAEVKGERVETERTPASIQQEVDKYTVCVQEAKKLAGKRERIEQDLKEVVAKFTYLKTNYRCFYTLSTVLEGNAKVLNECYETMIAVIGNVLTGCFQTLISSRGYNGRLVIEHETKELYYFVCPDTESNQKTKDAFAGKNSKVIKTALTEYTNGLSGGERSFATICFIISMWQIMECPFFILDEFDVFMDAFNRKASQNALIAHAHRYKGHQFFLLTPLDITEFEDLGNTKIFRMYPPIRRHEVAFASEPVPTTTDSTNETNPAKRRKR